MKQLLHISIPSENDALRQLAMIGPDYLSSAIIEGIFTYLSYSDNMVNTRLGGQVFVC